MIDSFRRLFGNRRHRDEPVAVERRAKPPTRKEINHRLDNAVDDFERTVRMNRDDFFRGEKFTANDVQQEVIFSTFRSICRFKVEQGQFNLCRNPAHEAANSGIAKCDEQVCPFMVVQSRPA
jgi:hypothetical protein